MEENNEWWNGNENSLFFGTERSGVIDYGIGARRRTRVAEKGRRARSKENHGAGPTALGLALPMGFDGAFFYDYDLFLEVLRGLTTFLAGIERGDMAVQLVHGGGRTVEHVAADTLGGGRDGELAPREDVRDERGGGTARRIGRWRSLRGKHGGEGGGEGAEEVAEITEFHGREMTSRRRGLPRRS